jgi:hypothetical protein
VNFARLYFLYNKKAVLCDKQHSDYIRNEVLRQEGKSPQSRIKWAFSSTTS